MSKIILDEDFRNHLLRSYPMDGDLLDHLLEDLGEYFSADPKEFICRRHMELQREGLRNEDIYGRIHKELESRRFAAAELSIRQIRRIIYG